MKTLSLSLLTVCGLDELADQAARRVTHVLSVLDPDWPEPEAFRSYAEHRRTTLRFHDIIAPEPGKILPRPEHVAAIVRFGADLAEAPPREGHLLVHCHMGVSRSTAAMLTLIAQMNPEAEEDVLFERLTGIRPLAWPNSLMVGFADEALGRGGRLVDALGRHYGRQIVAQPKFTEWMQRLGRHRELEMAR